MRDDAGFSLIEALVALVIMAGLLALLGSGAAWSLSLAWRQLADVADRASRLRAFAACAIAVAVVVAAWALLFFGWS